MQFSTRVPIVPVRNPITYQSRILSLGSCFAVNISEKFHYCGFDCTVNPIGILFQPQAIEKIVRRAVDRYQFSDAHVFEHSGQWHCFDVHSDMSRLAKDETVQAINKGLDTLRNRIESATHIIITLGTAWQYRRTSGELVANCHKVPQREFVKELDSVDSILKSLEGIAEIVSNTNPNAHLVFTISPVRHIKDGIVENQRSKAHLITALHQFLETSKAGYFPSYEIMMDELRDYRFYATDMVHPTQQAVDYIWERFVSAWISPDAFPVMDEVASVRRALAHKPFNPDSAEHAQFTAKLESRVMDLRDRFGIAL